MYRKMNEPLSHTSLTSQVYAEIEEAILSGELSSGESLSELKLSARLGVSRTPVREALSQLEREGLVRSIPNKGAVVVGISKKDIRDIYTIRSYIEGLAARWAAENISEEELESLRDLEELQEYYLQRNDMIQIWHLDSRFHSLIYDASRSFPLRQMLSSFHHYIQQARELSMKTGDRAMHSVEEHRAILEAIEARDGDRAEKLTGIHIKNAWENVLRNLESDSGTEEKD